MKDSKRYPTTLIQSCGGVAARGGSVHLIHRKLGGAKTHHPQGLQDRHSQDNTKRHTATTTTQPTFCVGGANPQSTTVPTIPLHLINS